MINPIELLQLNYYEPERITPQAIAQASSQIIDSAGPEGVPYQGRFLSREEARGAVAALAEPGQIAFFYELCRFPGLSRFLGGEESALIEAEALRNEVLAGRAASVAGPLFSRSFQAALDSGKPEGLEALGRQLEQGSASFRQAVFQSAAALAGRKRGELEALAAQLEAEPSEALLRPLRGLQQFRKDYPAAVFNALPPYFEEEREQLVRAMGRLVRALSSKDTGLALAVSRYARQFRMSSEYAGRLDKAIGFLQEKAAKAQAALSARSNRKWMTGAGAGALVILVLALGLGLHAVYRGLVDYFYEPSLFGDTTELKEAGISEDELALVREAMKEGKGLSREQLEEILSRSGKRTEIVEYDATQLPWRERGQAAKEELSGTVSLGSAPMAFCFPPKAPQGKTGQQLTIVGDEAFDALVFFFNGRTYVQQAFIPANEKYELKGKFDDEQVVSTMIVFGQGWDPSVKSPCGTPGYFTRNIHYSGFAGYALDPVYPDLRSDLVAYLKKKRLLPSRELDEGGFFDLLEQYR